MHPQLEILEGRLPLGDTLLGVAAGSFLLNSVSAVEPVGYVRSLSAGPREHGTLPGFDISPTEGRAAEKYRASHCGHAAPLASTVERVREALARPDWERAGPERASHSAPGDAVRTEPASEAPAAPLGGPAVLSPPTQAAPAPPRRDADELLVAASVVPAAGDDGGATRSLRGESPYVYGIHDMPGTLSTLDGLLNRRGWVLLMKYLQGGPAPYDPFIDQLANAGYGIVVRLHWDTGDGEGTVPVPALYATFAANAKLTVQNNPSAKYWIVGNETNLCSEWPRGTGFACNGTRPTTQITPQSYAQVYTLTWDRIHELDGMVPNLHVIPAPTAVWAGDVPQWGATDFLCDFTRITQLVPHHKIDALAFHPKTHVHTRAAVTSLAQSNPVFDCGHNQRVYWEFPVYRDLLSRVPVDLRDRKVFLTELNPHEGVGWNNVNNGYLVEAYDEINRWNRGQVAGWTGQRITGMMVYRWGGGEPQWRLADRPNVQQDLRDAVTRGYRWDFAPPWSAWTRVTAGGVTSAAPVVVAHGNQLVALHRGDDQRVYASRSTDGANWTGWQATSATPITNTAPAVVTYYGYLFAFATGINGALYTAYSADAAVWSDWAKTTPHHRGTTRPVAVVDYFGYLLVLARGENQRLYLMSSGDGFTWGPWYEVPHYNGLTQHAPAMILFGERLYLFAVGTNSSVYFNVYDPATNTWTGWRVAFGGVQADRTVSAATFHGRIYLLRKDPGASTLSYAWSADGVTWNGWESTGNGGGTDEAPALAAFGPRLYGLRRDATNRGVYVSYFTG